MKTGKAKLVRCAIYTRVSTDQGLEQDFNSLDAQYDASQAYIRSQAHAGWTLVRSKYDDGGFSGGNTDRPALQRLLDDVRAGKVGIIVRVSDDLTKKVRAGDIIREIAPIVGGKGGGKPDMAEGGGTEPDKLAEAIDASYGVIEKMLA